MQQRAEKTRTAILTAARRLFAAGGFAATTVDLIALEAGVNKQRIYAYFGSKQQLFETVLLEMFTESEAEFEAFTAQIEAEPGDPTGCLWRYFQALHEHRPEFHRLLSWANLEPSIDLTVLDTARSRENRRLREWFEKETAAGRIRGDVAFESWLLTLMSAAYFSSANFRSLSRTLGESFLDDKARKRMEQDLARLFGKITS